MLPSEPYRIWRWGARTMETIDLPFFYVLGGAAGALARMPLTANRLDMAMAAFPLRDNLTNLFDAFPALKVCRADGQKLIRAVDDWVNAVPSGKLREPPDATDEVAARGMISQAKSFETVLLAELRMLPTYYVAQKGIYSTPDLIDNAENVLPGPVKAKLTPVAIREIRESGRCLAFDNATASGFHIMRAIEVVMDDFYIAVCKPKPKPTARLDSWGAYIAEFKKSGDPTAAKVVALLQEIKEDRNNIMHPEWVLSPDEAFTLFEVAQSAIIAMADKLPVRKPKGKKAATDGQTAQTGSSP